MLNYYVQEYVKVTLMFVSLFRNLIIKLHIMMIYLHIITNYVTAEILIFNILVAQITIFLYRNSTDVSTEAQCLSSLAWSPSDNDDALSMLR